MPAVFIYARQSDVAKKNKSDDTKDETLSLETQVNACMDKAKEEGDTVVGVYSEQWSGTVGVANEATGVEGRPRYTQMMTDIKTNLRRYPEGHSERITKIYVYKYLRLSRDPNETVPLVGIFRSQGIEVVPVAEAKIESTPMGELMLYAVMTFGKIQVQDSIAHAKAARKTLEDQGKLVCAGRCRYGYQYDRVSMTRVIDPDKEPIVRRIFQELASGKNTNQVMLGLRADAIPTPSGKSTKWTPATIYQIVKDKSYFGHAFEAGKVTPTKGRYRGGQRRVRVSHQGNRTVGESTPPIVSRETWEAANLTVSSRQQAHTRHTHWLIGRVFCKVCGANLCRVKHHSGNWYWRCPKYTESRELCSVGFAPTDKIESEVIGKVWTFLMNPVVREARLASLKDQVTNPEWEGELARNREEVAKIKRQIGALMTQWSEDPDLAEIRDIQVERMKGDLKTRLDLVSTLEVRVEQSRRSMEVIDHGRQIVLKAVAAFQERDVMPTWSEVASEYLGGQSDDDKRWLANLLGLAVHVAKHGRNRGKVRYEIDVETFRFERPSRGASDAQLEGKLGGTHTMNKNHLMPILL